MTKSGLMVGLGETHEEMVETFAVLREHGVQVLTVGQYLRPSERHLPVVRYWHPDEFAALEQAAYELGFDHVAAGPLVRSSYHADQHVPQPRPGVGPLAAAQVASPLAPSSRWPPILPLADSPRSLPDDARSARSGSASARRVASALPDLVGLTSHDRAASCWRCAAFILGFAFLTISAASQQGFAVERRLGLRSSLLLGVGIVGALCNPPRRSMSSSPVHDPQTMSRRAARDRPARRGARAGARLRAGALALAIVGRRSVVHGAARRSGATHGSASASSAHGAPSRARERRPAVQDAPPDPLADRPAARRPPARARGARRSTARTGAHRLPRPAARRAAVQPRHRPRAVAAQPLHAPAHREPDEDDDRAAAVESARTGRARAGHQEAVERPARRSACCRWASTCGWRRMLYGLLLPSGNDAAVALAQHVAGSVERAS